MSRKTIEQTIAEKFNLKNHDVAAYKKVVELCDGATTVATAVAKLADAGVTASSSSVRIMLQIASTMKVGINPVMKKSSSLWGIVNAKRGRKAGSSFPNGYKAKDAAE